MTSTEIALITTTRAITPAEAFRAGGLDDILDTIEREVRAIDTDISTAAGRKNVASLAYKVARSKTALDDMGKTLAADIKKQAAAIDAERKKARDRLDALKDEVRKPLDEYEAREAARVKALEERVAAIAGMASFTGSPTTAEIADRLAAAEAVDTADMEEFAKRGDVAKEAAVKLLTAMLTESRARDAERAELERLRREAEERAAREAAERAEREQREREERAAAAARAEAEAKAQREAEEAERRAQAERERHEQEKAEAARLAAEAEQRAADAERRAREAAERAEADRIASAARAEQERKEAEARAEAERVAAEERAKAAAEEAAKRERERIAAEQQAEREAAAKREADKAHRARINNEALAALVSAGLDDAAAKIAVTAIAKGAVPHVSIAY